MKKIIGMLIIINIFLFAMMFTLNIIEAKEPVGANTPQVTIRANVNKVGNIYKATFIVETQVYNISDLSYSWTSEYKPDAPGTGSTFIVDYPESFLSDRQKYSKDIITVNIYKDGTLLGTSELTEFRIFNDAVDVINVPGRLNDFRKYWDPDDATCIVTIINKLVTENSTKCKSYIK